MRRFNLMHSALVVLVAANLISCSSNVIISTPSATQVTSFADPFAYCAAVGTVDTPDARYSGVPMPDVIVKGLMKTFNAPPDAPVDLFTRGSYWRCMEGKVYACSVGANIPCESKADTSTKRCTNVAPQIVMQVLTPDARGFISNFWYVISLS